MGTHFWKAINSSASSRPIKNLQIFVLQCVYFCPCPFNPCSLNLSGAPDHLMLLTLSQTSSTSELRTRPAASTGLPEGHLPADALFPGCSLAAFVSSQRPWCSSISLKANYLNLWRLLLIWFDLGTLTNLTESFLFSLNLPLTDIWTNHRQEENYTSFCPVWIESPYLAENFSSSSFFFN